MNRAVLDASALLAALLDEPGADVVRAALPGCTIGAVNLSEVLAHMVEHGTPEGEAWSTVAKLGLTVVGFDLELARKTAALRRSTAGAGLSLADRACLALGHKLALPVLTTDKAWRRLKVGVEIRTIR